MRPLGLPLGLPYFSKLAVPCDWRDELQGCGYFDEGCPLSVASAALKKMKVLYLSAVLDGEAESKYRRIYY